MKKLTVLLSFTVFASALYAQAICSGQPVVVGGEGVCNYNPYILVFEDNFDGNSLDESIWEIPTGLQGALKPPAGESGTQEYNSLDNTTVSNGILYITAKEETVVRRAVNWKPDDEILQDGFPNLRTYHYTSSKIRTKKKFEYGKFEIRCKLAKGKSFFPAFWTFGGNPWNEIDVFEFRNEVSGNKITGFYYNPSKLSKVHSMNAHYDYNGDGNTKNENCPDSYTRPDFSQSFHTFTVIWTPYILVWFMDGDLKRISTLFYTMQGQIVDCNGVHANTQYIKDKAFPFDPMHIYCNFAIQVGTDGNGIDHGPDTNTPFPSSLEVDYIRYYKKMPCDGPLTVTDISTLNLSNEVYNIIIGTTIDLSGNFTVQSGQQLEVVARDEIVLGPGFSAEAGSEFVARIDPGICLGENKMGSTADAGDNAQDIEKVKTDDQVNTTEKDCKVRIFPNPNEGKFLVEFDPNSIDAYELYLIDAQGRILYSVKSIDDPNIEIDISEYSSGVYFLNILDTKNKNAYTHKIVKDK